MDKKTIIKNFGIVSYAIGGVFFLLIGIRGFVEVTSVNVTPQMGQFIFTILTTSFGVWSIRAYLKNYKSL